jgi:hypothetical protein
VRDANSSIQSPSPSPPGDAPPPASVVVLAGATTWREGAPAECKARRRADRPSADCCDDDDDEYDVPPDQEEEFGKKTARVGANLNRWSAHSLAVASPTPEIAYRARGGAVVVPSRNSAPSVQGTMAEPDDDHVRGRGGPSIKSRNPSGSSPFRLAHDPAETLSLRSTWTVAVLVPADDAAVVVVVVVVDAGALLHAERNRVPCPVCSEPSVRTSSVKKTLPMWRMLVLVLVLLVLLIDPLKGAANAIGDGWCVLLSWHHLLLSSFDGIITIREIMDEGIFPWILMTIVFDDVHLYRVVEEEALLMRRWEYCAW